MRIVKWVFGGLAAVVVVLGLTWVMVPKDRIINFALDRVAAQTGRDISVGGDAELKIFPNLVVVADQVSVANGGKAVGNDNGRSARHQPIKRLLNQHLRHRIHARRRLIKNKNTRVGQRGAGNAQKLTLPNGQVHRSLQNRRLVPLGQS